MKSPLLAALSGAFLLLSCSQDAPPASAPDWQVPAEWTVLQRTTTEFPGTRGQVRLTIDDVTRDQVTVSLASAAGTPLLAPISLREGGVASFSCQGTTYALELKRLHNARIGADTATFVLGKALGESEKIVRLLEHLRSLEGAEFLRNGRAHGAEEAAEHLERKWRAAEDRVTTARDFVDGVATRSSVSGRLYEIRFADGSKVAAGEYLHGRLRELER